MRFKNKRTNQIVRANNYAELFAFSHNSNYEKVEEVIVTNPIDKVIKK